MPQQTPGTLLQVQSRAGETGQEQRCRRAVGVLTEGCGELRVQSSGDAMEQGMARRGKP